MSVFSRYMKVKKRLPPALASAAPLLLFCPLFFAHSNVCYCSVGGFASVVFKVSCSAHSTTSAESFASQSIFPAILASATRTETTQNGSEAEAGGSRNSKKRNEKKGMSTAALRDYKCVRPRFLFFFSSVIGWFLEKRGISNVCIIERPGKYIFF
ncbi:unnamed protein product [Sphagnum troendelagicum]